jgi:hypothetical protein
VFEFIDEDSANRNLFLNAGLKERIIILSSVISTS